MPTLTRGKKREWEGDYVNAPLSLRGPTVGRLPFPQTKRLAADSASSVVGVRRWWASLADTLQGRTTLMGDKRIIKTPQQFQEYQDRLAEWAAAQGLPVGRAHEFLTILFFSQFTDITVEMRQYYNTLRFNTGVLRGNSANALFIRFSAQDKCTPTAVPRALVGKFQIGPDDQVDDMVMDVVNSILVNHEMASNPRITSFMTYVDSFLTYVKVHNSSSNSARSSRSGSGSRSDIWALQGHLKLMKRGAASSNPYQAVQALPGYRSVKCVVLEDLQGTALADVIERSTDKAAVLARVCGMLPKLWSDLCYMGKKYSWVHNDCHLGNLFVCPGDTLKLIDFGRVSFAVPLSAVSTGLFDALNQALAVELMKLKPTPASKSKSGRGQKPSPPSVNVHRYMSGQQQCGISAHKIRSHRYKEFNSYLFMFDVATITCNILRMVDLDQTKLDAIMYIKSGSPNPDDRVNDYICIDDDYLNNAAKMLSGPRDHTYHLLPGLLWMSIFINWHLAQKYDRLPPSSATPPGTSAPASVDNNNFHKPWRFTRQASRQHPRSVVTSVRLSHLGDDHRLVHFWFQLLHFDKLEPFARWFLKSKERKLVDAVLKEYQPGRWLTGGGSSVDSVQDAACPVSPRVTTVTATGQGPYTTTPHASVRFSRAGKASQGKASRH